MTRGVKETAKEVLKLKVDLIKSAAAFKSRLPLGRFGEPDEVARIVLVLVLASDLSTHVTGALVPVDGGFIST